MKKYIIFLLLFSINYSHSQIKSENNFYRLTLETNPFFNLNSPYFQGQNFLFNFTYLITEKHNIGISIGSFCNIKQDSYSPNGIIKYFYFPLLFDYNTKLGVKNNFLGIKIGFSAFTYFDSDFYSYKNFINNNYWPKYTDIINHEMNNEKLYLRKVNNFIISNFYYTNKINNKLSFLIGTSFYFTKNLLLFLNLGLNYHLKK